MPEAEEALEMIRLESEDRMQKSLESLKRDLTNVRAARATPAMLDNIQVEYYGAMTPINQLATINAPEPRMLVITPFDKGSMSDIEKALLKSDLGLTPQNDGNVIRLILPELSGERRQELVKTVKSRLEEARVAIRNIRRDSNDHIKKLKSDGLSEDDIKAGQDDMQEMTDRFVKEAEEIAQAKEDSILTV